MRYINSHFTLLYLFSDAKKLFSISRLFLSSRRFESKTNEYIIILASVYNRNITITLQKLRKSLEVISTSSKYFRSAQPLTTSLLLV